MNRGERRALRHYRLRGYRLLEANARAGGYELDLVLRRGRRLLVVEVKEKTGPAFGHPLEMVDGEKRRRVFAAAHAWVAAHPEAAGLARGGGGRRPGTTRRAGAARLSGRSAAADGEPRAVGQTQAALYAGIDLELSWSEDELPQAERTKHVHGLHPYLGKFVPQLVESLLARYVPPGGRVLDPFAGSGTTLVQALESGYDALGVDVAAFNCLLMRVKTARYDLFRLERELRDALARRGRARARPSGYLREWYAPRAAAELLHFRSLLEEYEHADVLRVVLARAARSARLTTHFDLDFPKRPQRRPYWCHKHRRTCRPVGEADKFLARYLLDTLARLKAFQRVRRRGREARVVHGDAREVALDGPFDALLTSPPYPGLIDYHEQHRYAYELLGLEDRRERELGAAAQGTSRAALARYAEGMAAVLRRCAAELRPGAPVLIVVHDRRHLYPAILETAGLRLVERLERHVNRRTGRRAGEFFESVLVVVRDS